MQALLDGVPGSRVKDRMAALEARKAEFEAFLAKAVEEPVLPHPNMAQVYCAEVARLADALNDEHERTEAAEMLRGLIDRIVLTPKEKDGRRSLSIDLQFCEAGSRKSKRPGTEGRGAANRDTDYQWLRGLAPTYTEHSWSGPSHTNEHSWPRSGPAIPRP